MASESSIVYEMKLKAKHKCQAKMLKNGCVCACRPQSKYTCTACSSLRIGCSLLMIVSLTDKTCSTRENDPLDVDTKHHLTHLPCLYHHGKGISFEPVQGHLESCPSSILRLHLHCSTYITIVKIFHQ